MKHILIIIFAFVLAACGQHEARKTNDLQYNSKQPEVGKEYVFAIHPLNNPARLFEIYGPLIDYLNRNIPNVKFRLEASRNYEEFEKKLQNGKAEIFDVKQEKKNLSKIKEKMQLY